MYTKKGGSDDAEFVSRYVVNVQNEMQLDTLARRKRRRLSLSGFTEDYKYLRYLSKPSK